MRRSIGVVVAAVLVAAAVLWLSRGRRDWVAPDFVLPDLQGQAVRLSNFRGKVVILNVWTTWCPPCREEMPSIERLYQHIGRDGRFVLLAVSEDEGGRKVVAPFVKELGLTFPVLLDPHQQVAMRYGVTGFPETFVIDRSGRVRVHEIGPRRWDDPKIEARLRRLADSER